MGLEGEGSGGRGGGKWGERGREAGFGYPPVHPLNSVMDIDTCCSNFEDIILSVAVKTLRKPGKTQS